MLRVRSGIELLLPGPLLLGWDARLEAELGRGSGGLRRHDTDSHGRRAPGGRGRSAGGCLRQDGARPDEQWR